MGVVEDLADQLDRDALKAERQLNDPNLVDEVASVLLAQSQIMQEAFMTAIRVHRSAVAGRQFIERKLAAGKKGGDAAKPPTMDNPDL